MQKVASQGQHQIAQACPDEGPGSWHSWVPSFEGCKTTRPVEKREPLLSTWFRFACTPNPVLPSRLSAGTLDYVPFIVEVALERVVTVVLEAGCGALKTQRFFPPGGAYLVAVGGLSTPGLGGSQKHRELQGLSMGRKGAPRAGLEAR